MKGLYKIFILLFVIATLAIVEGHAQAKKYNKHDKLTPINLAENHTSMNGTYEIDKLIIKKGDNILINSDNSYMVHDEKGELSFNMTVEENTIKINTVYKMQMAGPAFMNNDRLTQYSFIFDTKTFEIPYKKGTAISDALATIELHIYGQHDMLWQMPYKDGTTLVMKLEKETDTILPLSDIPYSKQIYGE